jgi:hypothetical protein
MLRISAEEIGQAGFARVPFWRHWKVAALTHVSEQRGEAALPTRGLSSTDVSM